MLHRPLILIAALALSIAAHAATLPANAQVEADARAAVKNGSVTRVEIDGGWKQEREAGYTFANVAKQAIIADKQNPDGSRQQFNALVIYKRGAPNDAWQFDRLFSYGFKSLDGDAPSGTIDAARAHALTLAAMRERPSGWMPVDLRLVFRVDAFQIVPGSIKAQDDTTLYWEIDAHFVVDDSGTGQTPGVKKLKQRLKVEAIQQTMTKQWILSKHAELSSETLNRQALTRPQLDSLPTLATAPFDQLYFGNR